MRNFILLNLLFLVVFVAMAVSQVKSWPAWIAFIIAWFAVDGYTCRDLHLGWWQWAALLLTVALVDILVLYLAW